MTFGSDVVAEETDKVTMDAAKIGNHARDDGDTGYGRPFNVDVVFLLVAIEKTVHVS